MGTFCCRHSVIYSKICTVPKTELRISYLAATTEDPRPLKLFNHDTLRPCTYTCQAADALPVTFHSRCVKKPQPGPQSVEMLPKNGKYWGGCACVAPAGLLHRRRRRRPTRRRPSPPTTTPSAAVPHVLKQGHAHRARLKPPAVSRSASEGMERLPGKSCATC